MRQCVLCYQPDPQLHRQLARRRWRTSSAGLSTWLQQEWSLTVPAAQLQRHLSHHELPFEAKRPSNAKPNARCRAILALLWRARLLTASQIQAMLYQDLSGAAAQTACSRDLRWLRERKFLVRSTLPAGTSLELGDTLIRRAACYSLPAREAGIRGRQRASEWPWNTQQGMLESNHCLLGIRQAARSHVDEAGVSFWDVPLGGWNAHIRLNMNDQITRRKVRWNMDGLMALIHVRSRDTRAIAYVHDAELVSAQKFITQSIAPWRSLSVDMSSLQKFFPGMEAAPALLVISRTPERSRELIDQIRIMRLALPPEHPPLIFVDQESLGWAFTDPVCLTIDQPALRRTLPETLEQMLAVSWNAGQWQMNGGTPTARSAYTR